MIKAGKRMAVMSALWWKILAEFYRIQCGVIGVRKCHDLSDASSLFHHHGILWSLNLTVTVFNRQWVDHGNKSSLHYSLLAAFAIE